MVLIFFSLKLVSRRGAPFGNCSYHLLTIYINIFIVINVALNNYKKEYYPFEPRILKISKTVSYILKLFDSLTVPSRRPQSVIHTHTHMYPLFETFLPWPSQTYLHLV